MPITQPIAGFDPIQLNSFLQQYGESVLYDDFLYGARNTTNYTLNWLVQQSGGTDLFALASADVVGHPGILELDTVAGVATNKIGVVNAQPLFPLPNGYWKIAWLIMLPILSGAGDTFVFRAGLGNVSATLEFINGAYFEYSDGLGGGNWQGCAANGGVSTKITSTIAPVAAQWTLLSIVGQGSALATYSVDGVSIGSVSTNLPTGITIKPAVQLFKLTGLNNRVVNLDLCYFGAAYSAFR
jgi:hypothetical protein